MSCLRPGRRTAAILTILLLLSVAASDFLIAGFWLSHPMLTAIVSALVVVLLSVAVIEVVLSRRSERRWRILAQTRRRAGRPRTSGSPTTSLGPSTSAPASKTQPGTWRCVCCRKPGGIAVQPSSPQPPGLLALYRLQ